jgi:CheY-like chemotaxis protein
MSVRKTCIVVADDDPQLLRLITRNLEFEDYTVTPVGDGEQALSQIERSAPDLVLLDVMMPKMDGFTVCLSPSLVRRKNALLSENEL